jgi:hypothetical protein
MAKGSGQLFSSGISIDFPGDLQRILGLLRVIAFQPSAETAGGIYD